MNASTRPTISELSFQKAVIDYARQMGFRIAHFHQTRREVVRRNGKRLWIGDADAAGFPDLCMVRERVVYAEIKGPKTRVTDQQLAWGQALLDAGEEWYLWRAGAPGVWAEIEKALGRGRG